MHGCKIKPLRVDTFVWLLQVLITFANMSVIDHSQWKHKRYISEQMKSLISLQVSREMTLLCSVFWQDELNNSQPGGMHICFAHWASGTSWPDLVNFHLFFICFWNSAWIQQCWESRRSGKKTESFSIEIFWILALTEQIMLWNCLLLWKMQSHLYRET